jgi:hypothetical protein
VYDMYPWDARADGPRTPAPRNSPDSGNGSESTPQDPATAAVQVALDRRDNGGDAAPAKAPAAANHAAAPATTSRGHK